MSFHVVFLCSSTSTTTNMATGDVVQERYTVGGSGGTSFQVDRISQGQVVTKLQTWASSSMIRGIKFTFSDGSEQLVGKAEHSYKGSITFDWDNGEYITYLSVFNNKNGKHVGAYHVRTNKGQSYFPKMDNKLKTEHKLELGSGIMLGALGKSSDEIDSLGFLMMRTVIGVDMINIVYDLQGDNLLPPRKVSSLDVTLANQSRVPTDNGYQKVSREKETGGQWSTTTGLTFGQSYKVEAGVPFVEEGEVSTSWKISETGMYGQTWSTNEGSEISVPLVAAAMSKTRITCDYFEGTSDKLPYTAQMRYFLDNGSQFCTAVRGVYDGVSNSDFVQDSQIVAKWNDSTNQWDNV